MTGNHVPQFRAHYLWVDAILRGFRIPEVGVVEHRIASPWPADNNVEVRIQRNRATFGRWDVTIESTIGGSRETLIGLDGLQLAESVYRTVHRDVMTAAHARQWTRLHAALVDCNGVRVAIAGHSGAGKTTLALALALRGAQLRADEGVFIRGTDAVGLPRRVHLKAGTFDVLPEIKAHDSLYLPYAPPVWALDPSTLPAEPNGGSAVRGIDLVLILDGWDEGPTRLAPMPVSQAIQSLAEQSALWSDNHGLTLRNIAALLSNAPCLQTDSAPPRRHRRRTLGGTGGVMRDTRYLISMLEPACGADVIRLCSQQDWPRVIDAAARHKVLPLLASRAVEAGFASVLPASFAEMLSESSATASSPELTLSLVHHRNTIRISDLDAQRVELQELLHSNGFPTVALKGAALLERNVWPNPAARRMTDIDLLVVDPAHAVPANEAILDFGYRMVRPDEVDSDAIDHDDHQEPALLRDDRHGSVEIHSHLLPRFARHALTREAAVRGISAEAKGSRLAIADVTLHVIAHARLADRALIRADLSLNSVFDVGYLLASEPALAVTLSRRQLPRDVRRAVNVHWAAVESIFGVSTGASTTSARWWWRWTLWLADRPRLHSLYRDLVMVPLFLDRDRLSIRDGRDLHGWDLARARVSHFVRRARTAVEDAGGAA